MAAAAAAGRCGSRWREMAVKGEDDEGMRTVECLRGRLLAERVASRTAKEEAELLSKRLAELERLMAAEIKARNRADKRLKYALKKLESLKLVDISGISITSGESLRDIGENSSPACSSLARATESNEAFPQTEGSRRGGVLEESDSRRRSLGGEGSINASAHSTNSDFCHEGSWSSVGTSCSINKGDASGEESVASKESFSKKETITDANREYSSSSEEHDNRRDEIEYVDNSLALVPADLWPGSDDKKGALSSNSNRSDSGYKLKTGSGKPLTSNDAEDVLVALRHVKKQLQHAMSGRHVVSA